MLPNANPSPYPFPSFPEKVVSLVVSGPRTLEYLIGFFSDDKPTAIQAGLKRLVDRNILRFDAAAEEFSLTRGNQLLSDIAQAEDLSATQQPALDRIRSVHRLERFEMA